MAKNINSGVGMKSVVQHLPNEALGLAKRKRRKRSSILFLVTALSRHISPSKQFAHFKCLIQ